MSTHVLRACAVFSLVCTASVSAQSLRVTGATGLRYIELRPFVRDSIVADSAPGTTLLRALADGRVVRCIPGEPFCHDTRAGTRVSTVPVVTDLEVSAWGLGQGVRLFGQLRARTAWGGNPELWPRGDDEFDVLAAYAEVERERVRVRAGRQWKVSGLGFYNFDGVSASVRAHASTTLETYVGRSLVRGLNEQRTAGVLEAIETLAPPSAGVLLGVQARYRPGARLSLGTIYQIDFRDDGAGLYAELLAADGVLRIGNTTVEGALEVDVASSAVNDARLRVRSPPVGSVALTAEVRHYRPYFELWTIWGAFSPVGFNEAQLGATWASPRGSVIARVEASRRQYGETQGEVALDAMRGTGWSLGGMASWSFDTQWRCDIAYRAEAGVGAARRDGHAGVQRQFGERASLAVQALAFQRLYEFRLDEGTVLGLGAETSLRLHDRAQLWGNAALYRHVAAGSLPTIDWSQRRASVRLQWTLGSEPGMPRSAP